MFEQVAVSITFDTNLDYTTEMFGIPLFTKVEVLFSYYTRILS